MIKLGLLLLVLPTIGLMAAFMLEQNQIRDCIDQERVWDYVASACVTQGDGSFIPFMTRYPVLVNGGMLVSILGLLLTTVGLYRPSKGQIRKN